MFYFEKKERDFYSYSTYRYQLMIENAQLYKISYRYFRNFGINDLEELIKIGMKGEIPVFITEIQNKHKVLKKAIKLLILKLQKGNRIKCQSNKQHTI